MITAKELRAITPKKTIKDIEYTMLAMAKAGNRFAAFTPDEYYLTDADFDQLAAHGFTVKKTETYLEMSW